VIDTEQMLETQWPGPGTTILVRDDPGLYALGRELQRQLNMGMDCLTVVDRATFHHMFRSLASKGNKVMGLSWRSDLEEERLSKRVPRSNERHLDYYDETLLFGRPTICVLARKGASWRDVPDRPRIRIDERYPNICAEYIRQMGREAEIVGPGGDTDLVLRMVRTDDVIDETGLYPMDRVLEDAPVLLWPHA